LRQRLHLRRQRAIPPPEFGCPPAGNDHGSRRMSVSGIVLPAACSASAAS
jgi:hypothetical protein